MFLWTSFMCQPRTPTFSKEYSEKLFVSQQLLAIPLSPYLRWPGDRHRIHSKFRLLGIWGAIRK